MSVSENKQKAPITKTASAENIWTSCRIEERTAPVMYGLEVHVPQKAIEVIPVGTEVEFIDGKTKAIVTQICIQSDNRISYELAWWTSGTRNSGWISTTEWTTSSNARQRIGFGN